MFGLFSKTKKYKNLNAAEFKAGIGSSSAVIIDVRSQSEVERGSIPGRKVINVSRPDFVNLVDKLDKSKSYYLYCRSGMRSAHACRLMYDLGFRDLYNLRGGIIAWNRLES